MAKTDRCMQCDIFHFARDSEAAARVLRSQTRNGGALTRTLRARNRVVTCVGP
jgi:hypothetical protein